MGQRRLCGPSVRAWALVWLVTVLSGCASVLSYSVGEEELQLRVDEAVAELSAQALDIGVPAKLSLEQARVEIGPEDAEDRVRVLLRGKAALELGFREEEVGVQLQLQGRPSLVSDERAIYLRDLELLQAQIDSAWFRGDVGDLVQPIMGLLNDHLAAHPVHRIDEGSSAAAWLQRFPARLTVEPGRLLLVPGSE